MKKHKVAVIGDGGWGTTLAILLSRKAVKVCLWGAFGDYVARVNKTRINHTFLPGIKIPKEICITHNLAFALQDASLVLLAVPSLYLRKTLKLIKGTRLGKDAQFLSVIKGIETGTLKRMSQVIHEEMGNVSLAVLSGPTIAQEVAHGVPTVAVVASKEAQSRKSLQELFTTDRFRIYTNDDVIGVELGGSLKNVIAIACGVSDGLGFGTNTKAALLSRGLAEIARLGVSMGACAKTFSGISGLGDLVTTCISPHSRNRFVGEEIGKGKPLREVQRHMQMVAEGVPTAKSAYTLALRNRVDMPITKEVYRVLYKNKSPFKALKDLMTREKKEE